MRLSKFEDWLLEIASRSPELFCCLCLLAMNLTGCAGSALAPVGETAKHVGSWTLTAYQSTAQTFTLVKVTGSGPTASVSFFNWTNWPPTINSPVPIPTPGAVVKK